MSDADPGGRPAETRPLAGGRTVVGVDLGVKRLLVAAPASAAPDVTNSYSVGGGVARDLFDGLGDTLGRLDALPAATSTAEAWTVQTYRALLRQRLGVAAHALTAYCERVGADVVAVEGRRFDDHDLVEAATGATKAGEWVLPRARAVLAATLADAGIPTTRVRTEYTTQRCHECGELADVGDASIRCWRPDCPVGRVDRDRSAAVTIARTARADL